MLPSDITTITVTDTYSDMAGNPVGGKVSFVPTSQLTDATDNVVFPLSPVVVGVSKSTGTFTVKLPCTDNAGLTPGPWAYVVEIDVQGMDPTPFTVLFPSTLGASVQLRTVAPAVPPTPPTNTAVYSVNGQSGAVTLTPSALGALPVTGGTLTGKLTLTGTTPLQIPAGAAAGDVLTSDASGNASWSSVAADGIATASALAAETSRAETAEALLAPKASPALTGSPTAPTASALTDSTQVATTAYADSAVGAETSRAEAAEATLTASIPALPVTVAHGGTGQGTQQAAINALTGTQSAGHYLRSDGTNASLAAIQAGDVPALPYDASGAAAAAQAAAIAASLPTLTANVSVSSSGTLALNAVTEVSAGSNLTMTLPSSTAGDVIVCEKSDSSTNTVAITGNIRGVGSSTLTLKLQNESTMFLGYAGSWWPVAGHKTLGSLDARYGEKAATTEHAYYVSASAAASDSNDGLSWGSAKATIAGALTAGAVNIQLGSGTFTIGAADGNGNGVTLTAAGATLQGLGYQNTVIQVNANVTYGVVVQGQQSVLKDFLLQAGTGATVTYGVGVTSASSAEKCTFSDVRVNSGAGTVTNAFAVSPEHHADVADTNFFGCSAVLYSGAGWYLGDGTAGNVLDTRMFGCTATAGQYGIYNNTGGGFTWYGGDFGENTSADIYLAGSSTGDVIIVDGVRSENSARMLVAGNTGASYNVAIRNYVFQSSDSFLTAAGDFISYGFGGSLALDSVTYRNYSGTIVPLVLFGNQIASTKSLTVSAVNMKTTQPFYQLFAANSTQSVSVLVESYSQTTSTGTLTGEYVPGPVRLGPGFSNYTFNGTARAVMSPIETQTLNSNGAVTIQGVAQHAEITLKANATSSSITNLYPGQFLTITWIQDSTGSRTYSWPSGIVWANGQTPTNIGLANDQETAQFYYDGTNLIQVGLTVGQLPPTTIVAPNIQSFTSTGTSTWTKPTFPSPVLVEVTLIGPGGGGGAGMQGAASSIRTGGGGGAGGSVVTRKFANADLTSTVSITIPTGGNGAAGQATTSTNGAAGSAASGSTLFGSYMTAAPGSAGNGGSTAAAAGGIGIANGGTGGASSTAGAAGAQNANLGASGGGAGGTIPASNTPSNGGNVTYSLLGQSGLISGGTVDTALPAAHSTPTINGTPATGGPGGAASINAASYSFTATNASPCVFTATGSAYANGATLTLTGGSLPAGFATSTTYFVVSVSGTSFSLAATSGGAAINSTSTGSGTVNGTGPQTGATGTSPGGGGGGGGASVNGTTSGGGGNGGNGAALVISYFQ